MTPEIKNPRPHQGEPTVKPLGSSTGATAIELHPGVDPATASYIAKQCPKEYQANPKVCMDCMANNFCPYRK